MINDLVRGGGFFWRGLSLIWGPRIRVFAFTPVLLSVLVFALTAVFAAQYFADVMSWARDQMPEWLSWLDWLGWIVFGAVWILAIFFGFIVIANLLASPFNGLLAEAVEKRLEGRELPSTSWGQLMKKLPHILFEETKKILYYLILSVPFLLLSCVFGPFGAAAWAIFSAWMLALQFIDYPMDNNGLDFREMRRRLRKRPWVAFGFGGMTLLIFATPVLNLLAMPSAVAGGTIFWHETLKPIGANSTRSGSAN